MFDVIAGEIEKRGNGETEKRRIGETEKRENGETEKRGKGEEIEIHKIYLPFTSKGIISIFLNLLYLLRYRKGVFHITGDVHYALLALPKDRTILTIHDLVFMHTYKGIRKIFLKWIFLDMPIRRAKYITTISEKSKQEIIDFTNCDPEKILVIPNPVKLGNRQVENAGNRQIGKEAIGNAGNRQGENTGNRQGGKEAIGNAGNRQIENTGNRQVGKEAIGNAGNRQVGKEAIGNAGNRQIGKEARSIGLPSTTSTPSTISTFSTTSTPSTTSTLLFLGTKQNKNLECTIAALYELNVHLRIIGEFETGQKELLEKFNINYSNAKNLTEEELQEEYQKADVVLFPSTYEGFGLPVIEGFLAGKPVITSNISPMKDVSDGAAVLVDPYSIASIRAGIIELIASEQLQNELSAKGSETIKKYLPSNIANIYMKLWMSVDGNVGTFENYRIENI